jgi:beta-phosphoglucomutase-like phosphatase (HAD superfamily)
MSRHNDKGLSARTRSNHSELAVVFDMDGVLLDSEPLHLQALNEVLAPLGHQATAAENEQFLGWTSEECWRVLIERYDLPADRLQQYLARYDECLLHILQRPVAPMRGAPELLARLRGLVRWLRGRRHLTPAP